MSIREVCNRSVVVCFKHVAVNEAARIMREQHVGCLVIVEETEQGRIPIGILTDRDIVVAVVAPDLDARNIAVGEVMRAELAIAREDDVVIDAIRLMRRRGIRRMPVVGRDGSLVGLLTLDDLLQSTAENLHELAAAIARERVNEAHARA